MIYGTCVACKKRKWWVMVRTYIIPKAILAVSPHLHSLNGMTSDGKLCGDCFRGIKEATLGIPKSVWKRLVLGIKGLFIRK